MSFIMLTSKENISQSQCIIKEGFFYNQDKISIIIKEGFFSFFFQWQTNKQLKQKPNAMHDLSTHDKLS